MVPALAQNRLAFPARLPRLNQNHPARANLRMAAVSLHGGAMRDLLTNYTATNTQPTGEGGPLGNVTAPGANASPSVLAFPAFIPGETLNEHTFAAIFQPRAFGVGQGIIGENSAGPYYKLQTGGAAVINLVAGGTVMWTVPAVGGQCYFGAVGIRKIVSTWVSLVKNLTTGQIWTFTGSIGGTVQTVGAAYNVLTYNVAGTVNNGRVAAASLSTKFLPLSVLSRWANDPWSLWYAPLPPPAGRTVPASAAARAGGAALMIGA